MNRYVNRSSGSCHVSERDPMRLLTSAAVTAVAAFLAVAPASAQTGMKNGSANVNTTKARCSPGDPNVMVDSKTKTYMMDGAATHAMTSGAAKTGGTSSDSGNASASGSTTESSSATGGAASGVAAAGGSADKSGAMSGMKSMCKSEAESMGAKMAPGSGMQKKSM